MEGTGQAGQGQCRCHPQERQNIIRYWLENLRAKQGESLHNIHFLEGQPIIPELAARGVIQQLFPLHEQRILKRLMKSWVQAVCEAQPLDEICDYFGVKIAMYFAWLGFYTSAMVYPAVFGSILYTFTDSEQVRPARPRQLPTFGGSPPFWGVPTFRGGIGSSHDRKKSGIFWRNGGKTGKASVVVWEYPKDSWEFLK
ncbi:anoctamin-8 [Cyanistes caeruleus]|uniref:anoctamin-8 n=1 Tax=Cyanistes caeruleus TaxID=156563 RepID=UPI000CDA85CB|nr:anoctamin-8 [Cyanistes caeruleus]